MSNSDHDYDVQQPLTEPVEPAPLTQDVDPPQLPPDGIRRLSPPPGLGDHNGLALHDDHAEEPMDFDVSEGNSNIVPNRNTPMVENSVTTSAETSNYDPSVMPNVHETVDSSLKRIKSKLNRENPNPTALQGLSDEERAARMDSLVAEYQQQRVRTESNLTTIADILSDRSQLSLEVLIDLSTVLTESVREIVNRHNPLTGAEAARHFFKRRNNRKKRSKKDVPIDELTTSFQELVVRATRRQDELVALMAELTVSSSADVRQSTPRRKSSSEKDETPPKLPCNVSRQASNDPLQRRDSQRSSPSPDSRSRNNRSSQLNNRNRSPMTVPDELEAPPTPEAWKKLPGRTEFNDNYPEPWKKLPGAHSNNRQNRSPDRLRSRSPCASSATCHHHRSPDRRRSRSPPASSRQRSRSPLVVNNRSQSRTRQPGPHRQCSYSGRWHYTAECPFVTSNEERMRIMDENKLCYRCLSTP